MDLTVVVRHLRVGQGSLVRRDDGQKENLPVQIKWGRPGRFLSPRPWWGRGDGEGRMSEQLNNRRNGHEDTAKTDSRILCSHDDGAGGRSCTGRDLSRAVLCGALVGPEAAV